MPICFSIKHDIKRLSMMFFIIPYSVLISFKKKRSPYPRIFIRVPGVFLVVVVKFLHGFKYDEFSNNAKKTL